MTALRKNPYRFVFYYYEILVVNNYIIPPAILNIIYKSGLENKVAKFSIKLLYLHRLPLRSRSSVV